MKVVSYSLFGGHRFNEDEKFIFDKYVLGAYFNARMNRLIYPGWKMVIYVDEVTLNNNLYYDYIDGLVKLFDIAFVPFKCTTLCQGMIQRMDPIFNPTISHVICRDLDSLTTYREAQCVQEWVGSDFGYHAINDNPSHSGLMGGMIGIKPDRFKLDFPQYDSLESFIGSSNLEKHGSDQDLINSKLSNKINHNLLMHSNLYLKPIIDGIDPKLWESNLCISFIGSPGVNEMETLRFFKRFDNKREYIDFEKQFNNICYWRR
jgi:hypothetical protein